MKRIGRIFQVGLLLLAGCQSTPAPGNAVAATPTVATRPEPSAALPPVAAKTEPIDVGHALAGQVDQAEGSSGAPSDVQLAAHQQDTEKPSDASPQQEWVPAPLPTEMAEPLLTLADLEGMALAQNPALAERAAHVQALRGNFVQVGLPPNPTAGYTASEIGDDGKAGQQGAYVGQEFITGNKLGLNRAVASQQVRKAEQEWAAMRQRVLTDVRTGYYEVLIAQERLAMTEQLASTSQNGLQAVEALIAAREAAGTDLLQARVEANTASLLVENARAAREGAWRRLGAVLGNADLPTLRLAGNARRQLPVVDFDESLALLLARSPELAAVRAEIDRARWATRRARAEVVPNVNVQSSVQYDHATDDTIVGVQFGLPLPIINRNQGGIQQAHGELMAATWSEGRIELGLRRRLATVYQEYLTARQQVDRYGDEILPTIDETLSLTTEGYRAGEFGYLQLLTVQRTYFQTHLSYLNALQRMWRASRQIEGLLLTGSLESGLGGDSDVE